MGLIEAAGVQVSGPRRWSWKHGGLAPTSTPRAEDEIEIERERVEWVFGLTGGELSGEPWRVLDVNGAPENFPYWYHDVPEYAASDFPRHDAVVRRTVIADCLYGDPPDVVIDADDGDTWRKVKSYSNSGEAECPGRNPDDPDEGLPCDLCDDDDSHGLHGTVSLGDGWAEVVYEQDDLDEDDDGTP